MVPLLAVVDAGATGLVVLLDVALILVVSRLFGRMLRGVGQPAVVGEILAGIALGPTLLGLLAPDVLSALFPDDVRGVLKAVATVGLVLFMFGVGHESDLGQMRRMGRRVGALSVGSVAVPAVAGVAVALLLWPAHDVVAGEEVPLAAFAAFLAIALSVTAFPVLARILDEAGLLRAPIGALAMTVAAVTDLVAWSALAVVVAATGDGGRSLVVTGVLVVVYAVVLVGVVRPGLRLVVARLTPAPALAPAAVLLVGLALSAGATEALGLHAAIGAFAFGLVVPRGTAEDGAGDGATCEAGNGRALAVGDGAAVRVAGPAERGAAALGTAGRVLVPVFFLTTGLTVDLTGLTGAGLATMALLFVVATLAKFGGVGLAARLSGAGLRESAALGTLMNARGLTELVILEVGRSAGILDEVTFTALVGVALLTTVLTGPLFRRLHRPPGPGTAAPAAAPSWGLAD
ncbi:cation:proton antiporter [Patulibacter americanus]|uniref:cation:proton antiporter n=1 Tax=Patulibacter americanus TaxID=588672 RepID=UPI0003B68365|nr:cation:proton antiporter [Patulibacter americanus]